MATTYTVVKGDTLWKIAQTYGTTVNKLVELNHISNPNYIVVGQVIKLDGSADPVAKNTASKAIIKVFGLQSNTDRTMYATWTWDKANTENYQVKWYYDTGDDVWFVGSDSTVTEKQCTYSAPTNATRVKFKVKPISKKRTVNKKETTYWTAAWSTEKSYAFKNNPPTTPPVPAINVEEYRLTLTLDNLDVNATEIQFQIVKDNLSIFSTITAPIKTGHVSTTCTIRSGSEYKARCRAKRGNLYSDWTEYTTNVGTIPETPGGGTKLGITARASSETSIYIEWPPVKRADTYELEYTTNKNYFDGSDATTVVSGIETFHYEKTGLTAGEEYFFRVRSVNEDGASGWSEICSTVIGTEPSPPTTWSSTTTLVAGDPLTLYWVHNCEDGSSQTYAELELTIDGSADVYTIKNSTDEDEKDKTSSYVIDSSKYLEGTKIQWRVRTAGVTKVYGDWSIQRTVDIYAPPVLEMSVTNSKGENLETLESFPFYISALAGPNTQLPIGYHLIVIANDAYETVDDIGNLKIVNKGEQIYSKYFDTEDQLLVEMSAGNIDLENNVHYTVTCTVAMNTGLNTEASCEFVVAWEDTLYEPNAEIAIDTDTISASIRPYCEDEEGNIIEDLTLAVYRREFDGGFTEIASEIANTENTFVTDPHPSLDYARYRIVAKSKTTGAVSFYDVPGYPVGCKEVILQWAEEWSSFETSNEDAMEEPSWTGSMLRLPYNIDISDSNKTDVELVQYIGRKRPVTYYGTQLGETSSWSVTVPKSDVDTLYALRRLSIWSGDVYAREPSGSGYWANVVVSFSQKHGSVTIPVTLSLTRVEGGV